MFVTTPKLPILLIAALLGGCSLVAMRGVDPKWDGSSEPKCSESYFPVYVDAFLSLVAAGTAVDVAQHAPPLPDADMVISGAVITSLLFTTSVYTGASWYKDCRKAKARVQIREALAEAPPTFDVEPTALEGYFCTYAPSQPDLYTCERERDICEQVRKALAMLDGEACAPRKFAWCFDINRTARCFGTQYACEEQRAASVAKASPCIERS